MPSPPTVCIDARYVRERPSGIGLLVEQLVKRAPRLAPDLRFLLLKHRSAPPRLCNAPNVIERELPWEANGPVTMWALPRVVDLRDVDLFHAPFNILPSGLKMPAVATLHDLMWRKRPELASEGPLGEVEARFYANGIQRALAQAAAIITVSHATREDIRSLDEDAYRRTSIIAPGVHEDFRPLTGPAGAEAIDLARQRWVPGAAR